MPSTGMPFSTQCSKKPAGTLGAPATCTLFGPPERMTTRGLTLLMRSCEMRQTNYDLIADRARTQRAAAPGRRSAGGGGSGSHRVHARGLHAPARRDAARCKAHQRGVAGEEDGEDADVTDAAANELGVLGAAAEGRGGELRSDDCGRSAARHGPPRAATGRHEPPHGSLVKDEHSVMAGRELGQLVGGGHCCCWACCWGPPACSGAVWQPARPHQRLYDEHGGGIRRSRFPGSPARPSFQNAADAAMTAAPAAMERGRCPGALALLLLLLSLLSLCCASASAQQLDGTWVPTPSGAAPQPLVCVIVRTFWGHGSRYGDSSLSTLLHSLKSQTDPRCARGMGGV
jgi:hypothetical protein